MQTEKIIEIKMDREGNFRIEYKGVILVIDGKVPVHLRNEEYIDFITKEIIRCFKEIMWIEIDEETKDMIPEMLNELFNPVANIKPKEISKEEKKSLKEKLFGKSL